MTDLTYIDCYYAPESPLRALLVRHSIQVAERAIEVASRHPELNLDTDLLEAGAINHDIGVIATHAPSILCEGEAHYLLHGVIGGRMMREQGREDLARFCERHTGTGLTPDDFLRNHLPVPDVCVVPESLEEQVVCYADKFFSKSHPERVMTADEVARACQRFGSAVVARFLEWHKRFG